MTLWFRLLWLLLRSPWRSPLDPLRDRATMILRVWPTDLDTSLHMNNGRYLTIMDLGRLDFMVRCGLLRVALKRSWTPLVSAIAIRYRREMRVFDRFRLETRLLVWDAKNVVMEQVFVFEGGPRDGQVAARALFKGGIYDRAARSFVPISTLMTEIGLEAESPAPTEEVRAFIEADGAMKQKTAL